MKSARDIFSLNISTSFHRSLANINTPREYSFLDNSYFNEFPERNETRYLTRILKCN